MASPAGNAPRAVLASLGLIVLASVATAAPGTGMGEDGDPPASTPAAPMSTVVGIEPDGLTCFIGGAIGGAISEAPDLARHMSDGDRYRLFGLAGEEGEVIAIGRPTHEGSEGECSDLWRQELSLELRQDGPFLLAARLPDGAAAALPATLEVLAEPLPEHVETLRDFLARRGVAKPEPEIIQAIRTDLEGDGTPDYILNVVRIGKEGARNGDHSVVLVIRGEGSAARTFIVQEEVTVEDSEFPSTLWVNTIVAVLDIDGDGTAEIVAEGGYLYGGGWEVIRWDGNGFEHVLFCGCDG